MTNRARALAAWLMKNDLFYVRLGETGWRMDDKTLAHWLAEAEENQGIVEISAGHSVTGAPLTFNVWEAA